MKRVLTLVLVLLFSHLNSFSQPKRIDKHDFRAGVGVNFYKYDAGCIGLSAFDYGVAPANYLFYSLRIKGGFKLSFTYSYWFSMDSSGGHYPGSISYDHNINNYLFSPGIIYEWLNRSWIRMYSEVGYTINHTSTKIYDSKGYRVRDFSIKLRPHVVPFGMTVGKKLYGSLELCSSDPRGFINIGVGYRF